MNLWHRLFLAERSSLSLSFFRVAATITTGLHVWPSFFHFRDHYLSGAFKTYNGNFFTVEFLRLVDKSPDGLVVLMAIVLFISWLFFLTGLFSQVSGVVMLSSLIYFYALNDFYIGSSLAWDLLLVTLFLLCLTPYAGDYFSLDALRKGDPFAYKTPRPYFIQRLLQIQIVCTFFFTAVFKIYPEGNWLSGNPLYYLALSPDEGSTKHFLLREFFMNHPELCYWAGIFIIVVELLLPFLLFWPKTRVSAIITCFIFHVCLLLTLDVPAIFFFLFPPQLLLFIHPDKIVAWIEQKRAIAEKGVQSILVYDGRCQFCQASVRKLRVMDLFNSLKMVDYNEQSPQSLHPSLTSDLAASQLHLIEPDGSLYGGYFVLRRISWKMPMLYPLIPIFYFPGSSLVGPWHYRLVAKNRYLLHFNSICRDNRCFLRQPKS